jgi:hypothetical protein
MAFPWVATHGPAKHSFTSTLAAFAALSLTAIEARLEPLLQGASKKESSYADFLLEVIGWSGGDPLAPVLAYDVEDASSFLSGVLILSRIRACYSLIRLKWSSCVNH